MTVATALAVSWKPLMNSKAKAMSRAAKKMAAGPRWSSASDSQKPNVSQKSIGPVLSGAARGRRGQVNRNRASRPRNWPEFSRSSQSNFSLEFSILSDLDVRLARWVVYVPDGPLRCRVSHDGTIVDSPAEPDLRELLRRRAFAPWDAGSAHLPRRALATSLPTAVGGQLDAGPVHLPRRGSAGLAPRVAVLAADRRDGAG